MDIALTTPDGGVTYQGTFFGPQLQRYDPNGFLGKIPKRVWGRESRIWNGVKSDRLSLHTGKRADASLLLSYAGGLHAATKDYPKPQSRGLLWPKLP